jgi:NADPH-dependent 2,4-dienoyl-CoA reductase/sulfur reductase-like enzyme/rhodanese-related sulfurtransferase
MRVIIIGGIAAGASAAARLRRLDETAEIIILERDPFVSFAGCGMPYHIGGTIADREALLVQTPASLAANLALDVRTDHEVTAIDRAARRISATDHRGGGTTFALDYDWLVICAGASPILPPIPGLDLTQVHQLRNIPDMDGIIAGLEAGARRALVIGGSYIGLELVEAFRERGLQTVVVEMADRLMPWLDPEMTRLLHYHVVEHGAEVRLETAVTAIRAADGGLAVDLSDGSVLETDLVALATGVRPSTALAAAAGLAIGPRGGIVVDAQMRTADPHILAAGDIIETPHLQTGQPVLSMLAGPANRQGRLAADTIHAMSSGAAPVAAYRGTQGTGIVKVFDLVAGGTGMTETQMTAAGIACYKVHLVPNSRSGYYPGSRPMLMKVLFAPGDGRLLGAQVVGWDGVDKRIDVLAVALRAGMTVYDLEHLELAYAPPYSPAKDAVNMAGFLGANLLRGQIALWYAEDYPAIAAQGTILDVRSQTEWDNWHLPEAMHIPVAELRRRIAEVPKGRPVYVLCRSGFRSYLAATILRHNGFEAPFLSGGLLFFHARHRTPLALGDGGMPTISHAEDILATRAGRSTAL